LHSFHQVKKNYQFSLSKFNKFAMLPFPLGFGLNHMENG